VPPRASTPSRAPRIVLVVAVAAGLALLVGLVLFAGWRELSEEARDIPAAALAGPLLFSLLSYAAMARSYQGIARAADCELSFPAWLRITFVSNTVNYVVTSGGLSGFAVRMYLLGQHRVRAGRAVLISLVQTFLTNFTLLFFILGGFISLLIREQLQGVGLLAASLALGAFAGVLIYAMVLVSNRRLRKLTLFWVARIAHRVLRRVAPRRTPRITRIWRFQHNLDQGLGFLLERKMRMISPTFWICFDWILTGGVLWAAFLAVNFQLSFGTVMVGFGVGIFASLISFVPGGLGVMDASMTGIFVLLGAPKDKSLLAVLIFRICYQLLPLVVSVFLAQGVFRQALRGVVPTPTDDVVGTS
jgi:uncharacterized protein (TIRG00374 family)